MSYFSLFDDIQLVLGIIIIVIFILKLIHLRMMKTKLKSHFLTYIFLFLVVIIIVELIETLSKTGHEASFLHPSIHKPLLTLFNSLNITTEALEVIVPWPYLIAAIFIFVILFVKAKKSDFL